MKERQNRRWKSSIFYSVINTQNLRSEILFFLNKKIVFQLFVLFLMYLFIAVSLDSDDDDRHGCSKVYDSCKTEVLWSPG